MLSIPCSWRYVSHSLAIVYHVHNIHFSDHFSFVSSYPRSILHWHLSLRFIISLYVTISLASSYPRSIFHWQLSLKSIYDHFCDHFFLVFSYPRSIFHWQLSHKPIISISMTISVLSSRILDLSLIGNCLSDSSYPFLWPFLTCLLVSSIVSQVHHFPVTLRTTMIIYRSRGKIAIPPTPRPDPTMPISIEIQPQPIIS